jgi:hypothetical protein
MLNPDRLNIKTLFLTAILSSNFAGIAIAQSPQSPNPEPTAGMLFKANSFQEAEKSDVATLEQRRIVKEETVQERGIQYVDNCPRGKKALGYAHITDYGSDRLGVYDVTPTPVGRSETRAWFISKKTPPAPGLRVVIRNASQAQQVTQMPYTDREYNQVPQSEGFEVVLQDGHDGRFLAVNSGSNNFTYEIKRGDQIVESGQFSVTFSQQYRDAVRINTIPRPTLNLTCVDDK